MVWGRSARVRLLIVQPWFGAFGHPAQSLTTLAAALGRRADVEYLVSDNAGSEICATFGRELATLGTLHAFAAPTVVGDDNTLRALAAIVLLRLRGRRFERLFFFDSTLPTLAKYWPLVRQLCPTQRLGVLHMFGPERVCASPKALRRVGWLLSQPEVMLFLRTDELTQSWRDAFAAVAPDMRAETLPSLEIPLAATATPAGADARPQTDVLAFGVIGQIRPGKGIEWLVPAFERQPSLGRLTVAGEFNTPETRDAMTALRGFGGFIHRFMSEPEMLDLARAQDYLLMLYHPWDTRMESAVLYVAARVERPVVVYGDSWSGRMVATYGCGVVVPLEPVAALDALAHLPRPGSAAYDALLQGVRRFREVHSSAAVLPRIVSSLLG